MAKRILTLVKYFANKKVFAELQQTLCNSRLLQQEIHKQHKYSDSLENELAQCRAELTFLKNEIAQLSQSKVSRTNKPHSSYKQLSDSEPSKLSVVTA